MENIIQESHNASNTLENAQNLSSLKERYRKYLTDITNISVNDPCNKTILAKSNVDHKLVQQLIKDLLSPDKSQITASTLKNKPILFRLLKKYHETQKFSEDRESELYDVDRNDYNVPVMVAPYARRIYMFNKIRESDYYKFRDYMKYQDEIDEEMRSSMVDWLVAVHNSFRLVPETLYLSIYLLDKFLSTYSVPSTHLQLVGISSMFVASKYQEVNPPECDDFVYICNNAYNRENIISIEKKILESVEYDLSIPSAFHFLRRYSKVIGNDYYLHTLSKYYIELGICIYDTALWPPSVLASASLYLARKAAKKKRAWSHLLTYHAVLNQESVHKLAYKLLECLHGYFPFKFRHILRKYASEANYKVANLELPVKL